MCPLSATIHTSVLSIVDLKGLALDGWRPGRLIALEDTLEQRPYASGHDDRAQDDEQSRQDAQDDDQAPS